MNIFSINCFENWKLCLSLHPQLSGYGEIGRHARLRIWCRKACRFESYYPHFKNPLIVINQRLKGFLFLILPKPCRNRYLKYISCFEMHLKIFKPEFIFKLYDSFFM